MKLGIALNIVSIAPGLTHSALIAILNQNYTLPLESLNEMRTDESLSFNDLIEFLSE